MGASSSVFSHCFPFLTGAPPDQAKETKRSKTVAAGQVSAKFAGLRLCAASPPPSAQPQPQTPGLEPFACGPREEAKLEAWESQLGHKGEELQQCRRLREAVAAINGPKDPITMLKYIRARKGNVDAAADMYRKAMRRRDDLGYEPNFRLGTLDDSLHRRLDAYWKPVGLLGLDRDGDPVLWERLGICDVGALARFPKDFIIKHEVYTMTRIQQAMEELMLRLNRPLIYFTAVEDLTGLGIQHLNMRALNNYQAAVRLCEDDYPEMVKRALVIHAPGIFARLWKLVQHFFDEGTREKIQIVGAKDTLTTLKQYIDPEWIPECYGGTLRVGTSPWCEPVLPRPKRGVPAELVREIVDTWDSAAAASAR